MDNYYIRNLLVICHERCRTMIVHIISAMITSRNSSVGRALDWRSKGPWFDPWFRQTFFFLFEFIIALIISLKTHLNLENSLLGFFQWYLTYDTNYFLIFFKLPPNAYDRNENFYNKTFVSRTLNISPKKRKTKKTIESRGNWHSLRKCLIPLVRNSTPTRTSYTNTTVFSI